MGLEPLCGPLGTQKVGTELTLAVTPEVVKYNLHNVHGVKVLFDEDLADWYGVETGHLNRQVKANWGRFDPDMAFQLTPEEMKNLNYKNCNSRWGGRRYPYWCFTEMGCYQVSSVLNGERADMVSKVIIRGFFLARGHLEKSLPHRFPSFMELVFLQGASIEREEDLQRAIEGHIPEFLKALGDNFLFQGTQFPMMADRNYHRPDILCYDRDFDRHAIIDLKVKPFNKEHIGQMNFYLAWADGHLRKKNENIPVGLILCPKIPIQEGMYSKRWVEDRIALGEWSSCQTIDVKQEKRSVSADQMQLFSI